MPHPQGKQIAVATPDDARPWSREAQLGGKCRPPATRGTWLDSASSTCAGTSVRESGLSSFEPHTSSGSDTSSTQAVRSRAKTKRRSNGKRVGARYGQMWKTRRLERSSALRHVQQQLICLSDRLDAKCWEFSKLQIEVYRLRGELRGRRSDARTISRTGGECVDVDVEKAELPYWRDADAVSWPKGDTGRAWTETVSLRTT